MKQNDTKKIVLSSLFIAIGAILPILFHTAGLGRVFLPMHIPVMIAGIVLGWKYGGLVGLLTPFVSSLMTSMPPLFPMAVVMSLELATYAIIIGLGFSLWKKTGGSLLLGVYLSLIISMLIGRAVYGITNAIILGFMDQAYGFEAFLTGVFVEAVPGIILQVLLIPPIVFFLQNHIFQKEY